MDQVKYELTPEDKVKNEKLERIKNICSTILLLIFAATTSSVLGYFFYHLDTPGGSILFDKLRIRLLPQRHLEWRNSQGKTLLEGHLGVDFPRHVFHEIYGKNDTFMHLYWTNHAELVGNWWRDVNNQFECYHFSWKSPTCVNNVIQDCFSLKDAHWYGAGVIVNQTWPMETWSIKNAPFVTGDTDKDAFGGILSRYWLSSKGLAIIVDWETPLWVSVNASGDQRLCLKATYADSPYWQVDTFKPLRLSYKMCVGQNMRAVHWYMTKTFFHYPSASPSPKSMEMIRSPVWSLTPASPGCVNVSQVLKMAESASHFPSGETAPNNTAIIDLDRIIFHQNSTFDTGIQSPKELITTLTNMGFRICVIRSPSLYLNNTLRRTAGVEKIIFEDPTEFQIPPRMRWITSVGQLKVVTTKWFRRNVELLQRTLPRPVSFCFHGGHAMSLPLSDVIIKGLRNPDSFTPMYHKMATSFDMDAIFNSATGTQNISSFVSMRDRKLSWDSENGLRSIIPEALTLGIIGYPYVISPGLDTAHTLEPSFIGTDTISETAELYIRWLQTVALFPVVRFSRQPSFFNESISNIADDIWRVRQNFTSVIEKLVTDAREKRAPVLRPVWWIAANDEDAQTVDDQFLLGNYLMVAPVLNGGDLSRSIYLPKGTWIDLLRNETVVGPRWLLGYNASLSELPLFALDPDR